MKELEMLNEVVTDDLLSEMEMLHICGGVNPSDSSVNVYCDGAYCDNCGGTCGSGTCGSGTCVSGTCGSGTCGSGTGSNNSGNGSGNVGNGVFVLANCKGN